MQRFRQVPGWLYAVAAVVVAALIAVPLLMHPASSPPVARPGASATPSSSAAATATATATHGATPPPCAVPAAKPPSATLNVAFATALAFAPNGSLFIAERGGTILVANGNALSTFARVGTVTTEAGGGYSERGLLGLAISPSFSTDGHVYAFYSLPNRTQQAIVRWTDCAGKATQMTRIATLPAGDDCCHKGGRLAFGPDGKLYATLGEEHVASAAQQTGDLRGKILRFNPDGSIPADNPFHNAVWAYGIRNPFGIAFGGDGSLIVTSNGPSGDSGSPSTGYDVALQVTRGAHFQWPYCYGYSHHIAGMPSCAGMAPPVWSSEARTVVPTGATWVDAQGPSGYANHFVFCTYAAGGFILQPGSPHWSVTAGPGSCALAIVEGPDHALYYSDLQHIYRRS